MLFHPPPPLIIHSEEERAQQCSYRQKKMCLHRMGFESTFICLKVLLGSARQEEEGKKKTRKV